MSIHKYSALCFSLLMLYPVTVFSDALSFSIDTNTSSIAGQSGYIDLQFNALSGAQSATATIASFTTNGSLQPGTIIFTGDASGNLLATVTIDNGAANASGYNDYNEGLTFGSSTQFNITLSGPAVAAPNGSPASTFALSFYASDDATPLLSTDPSGASGTITINPDGSDTVSTFVDANGDVDTVVTPSAALTTPEPVTLSLVGIALIVFARTRARRSRCQAPRRKG